MMSSDDQSQEDPRPEPEITICTPPSNSDDSEDDDGSEEDQNELVENYRQALETCPEGHPSRATSLDDLADALLTRHYQEGRMEDLNETINLYREALQLRPDGHPDRRITLGDLGDVFITRFERVGHGEDLNEAIQCHREALILTPDGHPDRATSLSDLASTLWTQFQQLGKEEDIDQAIKYNYEALALRPDNHPDRSDSLNGLASALLTRFEQKGRQEDLDAAIRNGCEALALCPEGDFESDRSISLTNLANALLARFEQTGQEDDLNVAIEHNREALALCPEDDPDRSLALSNLSSALLKRYEQTGDEEDLTEAVGFSRQALLLSPKGHADRLLSLYNVANALIAHFEQNGQQQELEEAIGHYREALAISPKGHPDHSMSLSNLANAVHMRFEHTGQQEDLDEAIQHNREALGLRPEGHPDHSTSLNNFANALITRFQQTGQQEDLTEAIQQYFEALILTPDGHPDRSMSLYNLADSLLVRFKQNGEGEDLEEAIRYSRDALALCPGGHPGRSMSLSNLASGLLTRFAQTGQQEDLDESIRLNREALALRPGNHPDRSSSLNDLAEALRTSFEEKEQKDDIIEAIKYGREALTLNPEGHPDYSSTLSNLARTLLAQLDLISRVDGSDKSISHTSDVRGDEDTAGHIADAQSTHLDDTDAVLDLFEAAVHHQNSSLQIRLDASFDWINAARRLQHKSILSAYSASLALLTRISTQNSTLESQHKSFLSKYYKIPKSLVSDAVSSAIEVGRIDTAIEMLEQGRGFLWSRMKGYRHPLLELRIVHPQLADEFETIGAQLEHHATISASDTAAISQEIQQQKYQKLALRWDTLVEEIRSLDGFRDFLKAVRLSTLQNAASGGPVIMLNVSEFRSDAIIVFETEDPAVIPLPHFSPEDLTKLTSQFLTARASDYRGFSTRLRFILRDLWEMVVEPVVNHLKSSGVTPKSRIWWCPTSQLCALPLHAAGPYAAGAQNLPDLFISSYTPTLSALITARANVIPKSTPIIPKLLVVKEPDRGTIPAVEEEVRRIQSFGPFVEVLSGESANCENVVQNLATHSWSHFACHGKLNPIPFRSSFKLHNGQHLKLIELIKARLPEAELAFLSACHAAAVDAEGAPDEVIHLSAAMQFCGFRSVVGTLWAMADEDGPDVAQDFYRYMFRDLESGKVDFRDAATAINIATREMRRRKVPLSRWVNFVHIGA